MVLDVQRQRSTRRPQAARPSSRGQPPTHAATRKSEVARRNPNPERNPQWAASATPGCACGNREACREVRTPCNMPCKRPTKGHRLIASTYSTSSDPYTIQYTIDRVRDNLKGGQEQSDKCPVSSLESQERRRARACEERLCRGTERMSELRRQHRERPQPH